MPTITTAKLQDCFTILRAARYTVGVPYIFCPTIIKVAQERELRKRDDERRGKVELYSGSL